MLNWLRMAALYCKSWFTPQLIIIEPGSPGYEHYFREVCRDFSDKTVRSFTRRHYPRQTQELARAVLRERVAIRKGNRHACPTARA